MPAPSIGPRRAGRPILSTAILVALAVLTLPFTLYSAVFGWRGLTQDIAAETYLWTTGHAFANLAIFGHMVAGAALTFLAPLQVVPVLRCRLPALHRAAGYVIAASAVAAAAGGLTFIAARGTVGGPLMDAAFALYGLLVLVCAAQAVRHARARRVSVHRRWALRLLILALASWIYRLHYWIWYAATGGLASTPEFTGLFDRLTLFAFYLPYLLVLEIVLRKGAARRRA